jgi:hypothetical protein
MAFDQGNEGLLHVPMVGVKTDYGRLFGERLIHQGVIILATASAIARTR